MRNVDDELVSREEVTRYLFAVLDIREDLNAIRYLLEDDDGETPETDT
jgi:hypothetical protein